MELQASPPPLCSLYDEEQQLLATDSAGHFWNSITSRWRGSLRLNGGSELTMAAAVHAASHGHAGSECFSTSSSSTSSSTFLLHAASLPGSLPARHLSRAVGRFRRVRPRLLQQSQRPSEQRASERARSVRHHSLTASKHPNIPPPEYRCSSVKMRQEDAALRC